MLCGLIIWEKVTVLNSACIRKYDMCNNYRVKESLSTYLSCFKISDFMIKKKKGRYRVSLG